MMGIGSVGPCWGLTLRRGAGEKLLGYLGKHLSIVSHNIFLMFLPHCSLASLPPQRITECFLSALVQELWIHLPEGRWGPGSLGPQ